MQGVIAMMESFGSMKRRQVRSVPGSEAWHGSTLSLIMDGNFFIRTKEIFYAVTQLFQIFERVLFCQREFL